MLNNLFILKKSNFKMLWEKTIYYILFPTRDIGWAICTEKRGEKFWSIITSWGKHFSICSTSTLLEPSLCACLTARRHVSVTRHLATSANNIRACGAILVLLSWKWFSNSSFITSCKFSKLHFQLNLLQFVINNFIWNSVN